VKVSHKKKPPPGCRDNLHPPCREVRDEGGHPRLLMIFSRE